MCIVAGIMTLGLTFTIRVILIQREGSESMSFSSIVEIAENIYWVGGSRVALTVILICWLMKKKQF